jgi:hypothetical protein
MERRVGCVESGVGSADKAGKKNGRAFFLWFVDGIELLGVVQLDRPQKIRIPRLGLCASQSGVQMQTSVLAAASSQLRTEKTCAVLCCLFSSLCLLREQAESMQASKQINKGRPAT